MSFARIGPTGVGALANEASFCGNAAIAPTEGYTWGWPEGNAANGVFPSSPALLPDPSVSNYCCG